MRLSDDELKKLIASRCSEASHLEFKRSMYWKDHSTQAKVVRTALAMANLQGGGLIVFGVEDEGSTPGMDPNDYESFNQDDVKVEINRFADPPVEIELRKLELDQKRFVGVCVNEFSAQPVICKRDGNETKERSTIGPAERPKLLRYRQPKTFAHFSTSL